MTGNNLYMFTTYKEINPLHTLMRSKEPIRKFKRSTSISSYELFVKYCVELFSEYLYNHSCFGSIAIASSPRVSPVQKSALRCLHENQLWVHLYKFPVYRSMNFSKYKGFSYIRHGLPKLYWAQYFGILNNLQHVIVWLYNIFESFKDKTRVWYLFINF